MALRSARVTHAAPHGQQGAAVHAVATYLALSSEWERPIVVDEFLRDLCRVVRSRMWRDALEHVADLADRADPQLAGDHVRVRSPPVASE